MAKRTAPKHDPVAGAIAAIKAESKQRMEACAKEVQSVLDKHKCRIVVGYHPDGVPVAPGVIVHKPVPILEDASRVEQG